MVTAIRQNRFAALFWFLFSFAAWVATTFAQEPVTSVFIAPSTPFVAGSRGSIWLYCMNNSSNEVHPSFELRLDAEFLLSSGMVNTVLVLAPGSTGNTPAIAPGAFVKEEYVFDIPSTLRGKATLAVGNYNPIMLQVEAPFAEAQPEMHRPVNAGQIGRPRSALAKFFDTHLSPYEPIYFLLGNYPAAEFQLSLKYQIFDLTNHFSVLTNLYFGYTQTSYWDLISRDPSFFDTSYKPSLFAYFPNILSREDQSIQLDLQGGAEHESNGQGGAHERSIYTAYLQPRITFGRPGHLQFALQPRAWTYFLVGNNNPDIAQYRGYADLHAFLTLKKEPNSWANFQVEGRLRIGDAGAHPGVQIDARYKIPYFNPTIQIQYFEGYGQTFRQYNKEAHGLRVGLCLWYWPDYPAISEPK
jgi:outer membrane phospholipase A